MDLLTGDDAEPEDWRALARRGGLPVPALQLGGNKDRAIWFDRAEIGYWRTASGEEVDLVIETGGRLLPIEIKASPRPRLGDATHLRSFRKEYGKKARAGLLLHTGGAFEWLAPDILAVPWWRVL